MTLQEAAIMAAVALLLIGLGAILGQCLTLKNAAAVYFTACLLVGLGIVLARI